jgi:hydrogenase maturation protease
MPHEGSLLIIGVGNEFRRDDGAGLEAARRLKELVAGKACVRVGVADGAELIELWKDSPHVILIDAASADLPPGSVLKFDGLSNHPPFLKLGTFSSHALGVVEAVQLSKNLGRLPRQLEIYAICGESFDIGAGLTEKVREAVEGVVIQIKSELESKFGVYTGDEKTGKNDN